MRTRIALSGWVGILVAHAILSGCAGQRATLGSGRPADFMLDLTVMSSAEELADQRWARPARYIVEPGGTLRASVGEGVGPEIFPPRLRTLDPAEMDRLWRLTVESGLFREESPLRIEAPERLGVVGGAPIAAIRRMGAGSQRSIVVFLEGGDEDARNTVLLVERLADLSWIRE